MSQPIFFAVAQTYNRYPPPAPGVRFLEFYTPYPPDPVMMPRFGHNPGNPSIGPSGRQRIVMDPKLGHNHVLTVVVQRLLDEFQQNKPSDLSREHAEYNK